jgi:hypothetical protein
MTAHDSDAHAYSVDIGGSLDRGAGRDQKSEILLQERFGEIDDLRPRRTVY